MILKDYPEEVFNTTQQLLIQLQQLPNIPLSSSSAESPKGTKGSSASEHVVFEAPWAPSGCNPLEYNRPIQQTLCVRKQSFLCSTLKMYCQVLVGPSIGCTDRGGAPVTI